MTCNHSTHHTKANTALVDTYRIFLLTCWLEDDDDWRDPELWRFRMEDPRTGMRRGCVGIKRLATLLVDQIADSSVPVSISTSVQDNSQSNSVP